MSATAELEAKIDAMREEFAAALHRLEVTVRCKMAGLAQQLSLVQAAAKFDLSKRTLERLVAAGVFTDDRRGKRKGAKITLYEDELKAYRTDGEAGVKRLRDAMGRS